MTRDAPTTSLVDCSAVLFDLDGVLTPTAEVHMLAWRSVFDAELTKHAALPAYSDDDYFAYVDGKPRYDGVASMLASRGIELPWGDPSDGADADTVCGVGNRKNAVFAGILESDGVEPYPGSVRLVDQLRARGIPLAVVSSSKNARAVLAAAGIAERFETVVDGLTAVEEGIPGKPAPDMFVVAAQKLGTAIADTIVVEDAVSGVEAGAAGEFGLVIAVDRGVGPDALTAAGADLIVSDLAELVEQESPEQ
ncbi:MAG: beta-phosphoglucomutase family hydrolase [Naasia sp.]